MPLRTIDSPNAPSSPFYAQAVEVSGLQRIIYTSGQVPATSDGTIPAGFEDQARLAWANLSSQVEAAGMTLDNLVKVTVFLADRTYRKACGSISDEVLAGRRIAFSTVCVGLLDKNWLLEIEGVAVV